MPASVPPAEFDYRRLAESLPNLVWTCRADGFCDYLSPQWLGYTGRPAAEQIGYGWLESLHPDDRHPTESAWATAVETRSTFDIEFRIRRHDGVYRWFATRGVPEFDQHGTITRWYGTNTDIQDRVNAEQALRRLQTSLEHRVGERTADLLSARVQLEMAQRITHTGSWSFDLRAGHVSWSDELFRIFRLPVSDVCPQYAEQESLFHPDAWPRLQAAVAAAATNGTAYEIELRLADSPEGARYAVASCEVVRDADNRPARLFGTFQDITELVNARRERDAALERMALATSFAGVGIYEWNADTGAATWNDQMYRLFDVSVDVPAGYETWRSRVAVEDLPRVETAVRLALASQQDFIDEYRVVHRDGNTHVIRTAARTLSSEDGQGRRLVGVCLDITAEFEAERMRADNIRLLREFVRNAPAAIAMFDRDLRYIEASDRWAEMYGLVGTPLNGRSHSDMSPENVDTLSAVHDLVMKGASLGDEETPFRRSDGAVRYVDWEARPWHTESGAIGGSVLFTYDVTEPVELRHAVERQSHELTRSNEDLQQFAYAASHDLQEPLRAVSGFAQILQRRYAERLDAGGLDLLRHLCEGADRMRLLVDGLLLFSRAGSSTLRRQWTRLDDVLHDACENLANAIAETQARITAEPLPTLAVDRALFTQVVQNLLANSIKYAGATPPDIVIKAYRADDGVDLVVRDHGIGIPPSAEERVFQIFQRLHTRDEYPGAGIGLALCRRIVDRHGGRMWIAQPDGAGCELHVWMPLLGGVTDAE